MHMQELQPCLGNPDGEKCGKFAEELEYIRNYRDFISSEWPAPSASATFVIFHNLVSSSVQTPDKYLMAGQRHFYCLSGVLQDLPREFVADTPGATLGLELVRPGLPGLSAEDSLVSCPTFM
mmetsp:Transcript_65615/g.171927  ORF Transcript_65615/g.171927 Transcript_65615/m.171927 type:complete len:122 (+) Transcript_65615:619-984(+)